MILRNEDTAMSRIKQITKLVSLAGLEIGALAWLLRLGERPWTRIEWANLGRWLRVTPTDDAIAAIVWTMALVGTIWLVGTTLVYVAVRAMRAPTLIRAVASITLPAIRRVSEGTLAAILPNTADPPGDTVVNIFSGQFSDGDPGQVFAGIALVSNPDAAAQGTWQYSFEAGYWFDIGSVDDSARSGKPDLGASNPASEEI